MEELNDRFNRHPRNSKSFRIRYKGWSKEGQAKNSRIRFRRDKNQKSKNQDFQIDANIIKSQKSLNGWQGKFSGIGQPYPGDFPQHPGDITSKKSLAHYKHAIKKFKVQHYTDHPMWEGIETGNLLLISNTLKIWPQFIHMKDPLGRTPFFLACEYGYLDIAQWLYKHAHPRIEERGYFEPRWGIPGENANHALTPLEIAKQNKHEHVVKWLERLI